METTWQGLGESKHADNTIIGSGDPKRGGGQHKQSRGQGRGGQRESGQLTK